MEHSTGFRSYAVADDMVGKVDPWCIVRKASPRYVSKTNRKS